MSKHEIARALCEKSGGTWTALVEGQPCLADWKSAGLGTKWFWLNLAEVVTDQEKL